MDPNHAETLPDDLITACRQYEFLELHDVISLYLGFGPTEEFKNVTAPPGYHRYINNPRYLSISAPYTIALKKAHPGCLARFMKVNVEKQRMQHLQVLAGGGAAGPQRQPRHNSRNFPGAPYERSSRFRGRRGDDSGSYESTGPATPSTIAPSSVDDDLIRKLLEKIDGLEKSQGELRAENTRVNTLHGQLGQDIAVLFEQQQDATAAGSASAHASSTQDPGLPTTAAATPQVATGPEPALNATLTAAQAAEQLENEYGNLDFDAILGNQSEDSEMFTQV